MASLHVDEFSVGAVGFAHQVVERCSRPRPRNWILDVSNLDFHVVLGPFALERFFTDSVAKHHAGISARECVKRAKGVVFVDGEICESRGNLSRVRHLVAAS